jgi:hypothetical protein
MRAVYHEKQFCAIMENKSVHAPGTLTGRDERRPHHSGPACKQQDGKQGEPFWVAEDHAACGAGVKSF